MPDERIEVELVGTDNLEPMLRQAEKNVQNFRRNTQGALDIGGGAGGGQGGASTATQMFGDRFERMRRDADRIAADARAATSKSTTDSGASRLTNAATQAADVAYNAARLTGGGSLASKVGALGNITGMLGNLVTTAPKALLIAGGLTAGLAALGVAAASAAWGLGETALKADTLALKGAGAKTSIEQLAEARQRISLGVGRNFSGGVDFVNTQLGAVAATAAQAVGNQRPDERVANAEAIQRAADQRLEQARKLYGNQNGTVVSDPKEQARIMMDLQRSINFQAGTRGYVMPMQTAADAEAEAERARMDVAREQYVRAIKAQAQLAGAGGPPGTSDLAGDTSAKLKEQQKYVESLTKEINAYNEQLERARVLGLKAFEGDKDAAEQLKRLNEAIKTVDAKKLMDALSDAKKELKELTATDWQIRIRAAIQVPTQAEVWRGITGGLPPQTTSNNFEMWQGAQGFTPGAGGTLAMGQYGTLGGQPAPSFDFQNASLDEQKKYYGYKSSLADAQQASRMQYLLGRTEAPYKAGPTGPSAAETRLMGLIGQGPSTAIGLGDLRGGTYGGGPMAPGAGGPFEALFRIQDIAMNADKPGQDTRKWQQMYGLDKEQAKGISKQFQMGVFSPDVMKYVDTQALVDTSAMMDLADKSQEALAKELAKKGANPANIKRLLGLSGKDDKDTGQYKPAIDAMVGGMNAELTNKASAVEDVGKKWWGMLEKGLSDGAKDSGVLLGILRQLIKEEIRASTPAEK